MPLTDRDIFELLKRELEAAYKQVHPECDVAIADWRGQDIVNFQEELMEKAQGRISEKWFYTHIKGTQEKLPREDMLDVLARYLNYADWRSYKAARRVNETPATALKPSQKKRFSAGAVTAIVVGVVTAFWVALGGGSSADPTYAFCFADADRNVLLRNTPISVEVLYENQSPVTLQADSNGCVQFSLKQNLVRFVVHAPYFKTDTITRVLNPDRTEESIPLRTDDYALMMHYFSNSKVKDWKARKRTLNEMFDSEARIIQVYSDLTSGMELYNKQEFVRKLTTPLASLKNIEVLDVQYRSGKIISMRFIQQPTTP